MSDSHGASSTTYNILHQDPQENNDGIYPWLHDYDFLLSLVHSGGTFIDNPEENEIDDDDTDLYGMLQIVVYFIFGLKYYYILLVHHSHVHHSKKEILESFDFNDTESITWKKVSLFEYVQHQIYFTIYEIRKYE